MTTKEIKDEIKNLEWFIKNTSPTWDELEFFQERIYELQNKLKDE